MKVYALLMLRSLIECILPHKKVKLFYFLIILRAEVYLVVLDICQSDVWKDMLKFHVGEVLVNRRNQQPCLQI